MPQDATMLISLGDRQLIEDHGLGLPLVLYRAKEREILNRRIIAWVAIILPLLGLNILILFAIINWQKILVLTAEHPQDTLAVGQLYEEHYSLLTSLFTFGCVLLLGLFLLLVRIPSLKKRRAIVCEHGLLQVRWNIRGHRIEHVRRASYIRLIRKEGNPLTLSDVYENFDELRTLIRDSSQLP
jgi:hypothetical protein